VEVVKKDVVQNGDLCSGCSNGRCAVVAPRTSQEADKYCLVCSASFVGKSDIYKFPRIWAIDKPRIPLIMVRSLVTGILLVELAVDKRAGE
jgi:hypothetical protein